MERYLIVGPARSGTTVTHLCLAGHPNVSALSDEVRVDPFFTLGISVFTHGNDDPEERRRGFVALFDALCGLHRTKETRVLGCKTAISSPDEALTLVASLRKNLPGMKVILTLRRDIVAQLGSLRRAQATGNWHSWVKPKLALDRKIRIDKAQLERHAWDYLRTERELMALKDAHPVFVVSYEEDLLSGDGEVYQRIFDFLGLPRRPVTWLKSDKVAPPPEDYISDYDAHAATAKRLREQFEADPEKQPHRPPAKQGRLLERLRDRLPF